VPKRRRWWTTPTAAVRVSRPHSREVSFGHLNWSDSNNKTKFSQLTGDSLVSCPKKAVVVHDLPQVLRRATILIIYKRSVFEDESTYDTN
jgi:hypothetical protein